MAKAIADIVPEVALSDLTAHLKKNAGKQIVLYITGLHNNGAECRVCKELDDAHRATFNTHKNKLPIHQVPVELSWEQFDQLATTLKLTKNAQNQYQNGSGATYMPQTPTLLSISVDKSGNPTLSGVLQGDNLGNLNQWLEQQGAVAKARGQAATQASPGLGGCSVSPTTEPAKVAPKQPAVTTNGATCR